MTQIDKSRFEWIGSDSARREGISRPSTTFWKDAIGRLMKNKVAVVCFFIIVLLILSCIIVPFFSPFESREQHLGEVNKGFMTVCTDSRYEGQHHVHYFGTDNLGRDLFLRAFEGGRVSLMIAFAAVFVNLIVGLIYGGISGYIGGAVDTIMMRIVEIVNGIPYLIVVILLMMVLPKGSSPWSSPTASPAGPAWHVLCVVRCSSSRVRSISWRQKPWAAKSSRIIAKHLIPNALSVIIINVTLAIPSAIFTEAFLSYIGLGVPVPQPSWGVLAKGGQDVFMTYPYQLVVPAVAISLTMLSFNLLGDGLRDAFDPRLRR